MASCLGLYVEKNIIKYAKITKENNVAKVEAFGVKFFDNLDETIKQIVTETYSYKIPISINISNERYHYFKLFKLLKKPDIDKAVKTEFESICLESGQNVRAMESRYFLVNDTEDKEKIKAVHISASSAEVLNVEQKFTNNKLSAIVPTPVAVTTLLDLKPKENVIVVNMEEKTSITIIEDGQINKVQIYEQGMKDIFEKINQKENSFLKSYEICKNSTIYTAGSRDLQVDENEYLADIMPTLFGIVEEVKRIVAESTIGIDKIYITGSAAIINNIDLYFQEYIPGVKCEILVPYFLKASGLKINIKDYIEVNSAIGIALQGLGDGVKTVNFKEQGFFSKLTADVNIGSGNKKEKADGGNGKVYLGVERFLSGKEPFLTRICIMVLMFCLIYTGASMYLVDTISKKTSEAEIVLAQMNTEIAKMDSIVKNINTRATTYLNMIDEINSLNNKINDKYKNKNAIPNFLNQVIYSIPTEVQVTSIKNSTGKSIIMTVQALEYDKIGYFKGRLRLDGILVNVKSDTARKEEGVIKVTIEGELP